MLRQNDGDDDVVAKGAERKKEAFLLLTQKEIWFYY
jgi:hypothetical protein